MQKSESIGHLAKSLAQAQAQMSVAKKDSANPFFKSKYADLAAVVDAIKKPLADNGLSYAQLTDIDDGGVIVETVLMHESGEWLSGRLRMKPVKDDPQGVGSCITYARRYGLQAMIGVPSDDDDGNAASGKATAKTLPENMKHKPTDGAFEALLGDDQQKIRDIALDVIALVANKQADAACKVIDEAKLDADSKVALWSQLDSKVRSAIKKATDEKKMAEEPQL